MISRALQQTIDKPARFDRQSQSCRAASALRPYDCLQSGYDLLRLDASCKLRTVHEFSGQCGPERQRFH